MGTRSVNGSGTTGVWHGEFDDRVEELVRWARFLAAASRTPASQQLAAAALIEAADGQASRIQAACLRSDALHRHRDATSEHTRLLLHLARDMVGAASRSRQPDETRAVA